MSIVVRFTSTGLTAEKYTEIKKRLAHAGAGAPAGRQYHVCFGEPNNLRVSDIWDSQESFETFGQTLTPILEDLGVQGDMEFFNVHNIIEGTKAAGTAS